MNYTQKSYEEDALFHSRRSGGSVRTDMDTHAASVRLTQWKNQGNKPVMPKL